MELITGREEIITLHWGIYAKKFQIPISLLRVKFTNKVQIIRAKNVSFAHFPVL